jgi:methionyl-tRNA formyltransferase
METIDEIESGIAEFRKQDDSKASYAPKLKKQDGLINWKKDALPVKNLIRGCCPWPSAYTYLDGKLLKILDAEVSDTPASAKPATVLKADDEGILVACGKDAILIKRLQLESRKPLNASELLRGHPILPGTRLG